MTHVLPVRSSNTGGFRRNSLSRVWGACIVTVACWGLGVTGLSAATYYVAPNGNNTNAGTQDAPWKTIGKAFGSVKPGDTVLIRGGVYRESVSINVSGTADKPIVVKNYPGESPIIDGSLPVTGWSHCQAGEPGLTFMGTTNPNYDKIYVAQVNKSAVGSALNMILFENHERLQMACDPAQSNPTYDEVSEFRPLRNEGGNWGQTAYLVDSTYLTQPDDYWNGVGVRIWSHAASNWVISATASDFISSQHKIVFSGALSNPLGEGSQPDAYLLVNHPLILDQPGEFYVAADSSSYRVYLWPRNTADLDNGIAVLDSQQPSAVFLATSSDYGSYVTIDGLTLRNSKTPFEWVRWSGSSTYKGVVVRNCTIQTVVGAGFYMQHLDGATIENCQITNVSGDRGIMVSNSCNVIARNNIVDNTEQTGIYFGTDQHCQILNNHVGRTGTHGNGITTYDACSDILIANNVVTTQHVSVTLQNSSNLTYFNNILYNTGGGAKIANWGGITGKVVIAHNVMLGGSALWGDVSGHQRIVFNNVLEGATFNATTHNNNIFVSASAISYGSKEMLETSLTKIFVDPAHRNYHLASGSPARGFGAVVTSYLPTSVFPDFNFNLDAGGTAREGTPDAGAYQDSSTAGADQAPVLNAIGPRQVAAGDTLALTLSATDPDGGTLSYRAYPLPTGATFSGQTFAWTPSTSQAGSYQVTFEVSDSQLQDSEVVTITVTAPAANAAPALQPVASQTVAENTLLSFRIQATDPEGDPITYSASSLPAGAGLSGQTFRWTPTYSQAGNYTVTFSASDGHSQTSQAVSIKVQNVNRKPTLNSIDAQSAVVGTPLTLQLSATDPDGDALTYAAAPMPDGARLSGDTLTWTPSAGQVGLYDVTFSVSDGQDQDSLPVSITVADSRRDTTPPQITQRTPDAGAIQVPLNNIVTLTLSDSGQGVDPTSVVVQVDGQVVYQGDVAAYDSPKGRALRSGTKNQYRYTYQASDPMPSDHTTTVSVAAADLAGNTMTEGPYSFATEMVAFASGQVVDAAAGRGPGGQSAAVSDSQGGICAIWQAGPVGQRHIYAACLAAGTDSFTAATRVAAQDSDQCNPDLACGADGRFYAVWQDNQRGNWDIFLSISNDGATWSQPVRVGDSDKNEINPSVAIDRNSPSHVYVTWEDDRNGNADIYLADSSDGFAQRTIARVTTDGAAQHEPDIAVSGDNTIVIVWTDARNGQADIYGASSTSQGWTNVPLVTKAGVQTTPVLAADLNGTKMHLLWVDQAAGDSDVCYASFDGMPSAPLTGVTVADDTTGADQVAPAILCTEDSRVFACWEDSRYAGQHDGDTDLFVSELTSGAPKTNVIVDDGGTNSAQSDPALATDAYGNIYVVWTDARSGQDAIYYAGTTSVDPHPLESTVVDAAAGATIGTDPSAISSVDDVSIVVPPHACPDNVRFTIARIVNPKGGLAGSLGSYDFGPSGVVFNQPVTVTIPYCVGDRKGQTKPYWYNSLTGSFSQQGITNVRDVTVSPTLHALQFKTTHFTPYYVMSGDNVVAVDSSLAAGCSLSVRDNGSPAELILPFVMVALTMAILRRRDGRKRQLLLRDEGSSRA
jgi:hypothetical protein